jgi:hypothetical protein
MTADIRSILASVGANVDAFTGSLLFQCPECSASRKKKNQKCLSVKVNADGFVFKCHHCQWQGGERTRYTTNRSAPRPRTYDQQDNIEAALRIWRESVDPHGTLVEPYLAERGLSLPDEFTCEVIRFNSALFFECRRVPGMVALFRDIHTDKACGIHRTFLDEHGRKITRMMLGRAKGAAIKLDADENVTDGLHVGEGFETCLAAHLAGYCPVWALGSAGGIAKFPVLGGIEALTILTEQNDGGKNAEAVAEASERWHDADREVLTIEMMVGNDFNDAWREAAQ